MVRALVLAAVLAALAGGCGRGPDVNPEPSRLAQARSAPQPARLVTHPKFGDLKPHSWEVRTPWSYAVHGIDVSRWQSDIDWRQAKASGVSFAYIKATEGGDHLDPKFGDHWRAAGRAGVPRGAYHFYYFCRPAHEQARWFIRNVPRDSRALPHVLDMEWNHRSPTCRLRPDGATVRAEARRFLDILEAHYGRRPVIYTTLDFYHDTGIGRLTGTEFWLRSVAGHPHRTYADRQWRFWQYSGTGVVPGVPGAVDLNAFSGGADVWARWAGPALR